MPRVGDRIVTPKAAQLISLANAGIAVPALVVLNQHEVRVIKGFLAEPDGAKPLFAWISRRIGDVGARLAIRPSYPDEDRPEHANAGNYTSHLDIPNEASALRAALEDVVAEWESVARIRPGLTPELIVQRYVNRRIHGVALTADPDTGNRDYVVVSTTAGADDVTGGSGEVKTVYAALDTKSSSTIDIAFGESHLSDAELATLLSTLRQIDPLVGGEICDIEFGCHESELYVFQARPALALRSPPAIAEFQGGSVQDIAPAYKEIFSRHRQKRHRLYAAIDGSDLLFPRSFVLDLSHGQAAVDAALDRLAADCLYVPAPGLSRPRRKEDFLTIKRDVFSSYCQAFSRRHMLVTDSPTAARSGYLHVTDEAYGEWVAGGFDAFESGMPVECLDMSLGQDLGPLRELLARLQAAFPGAIAEWIEDTSGRIWLYDATLSNSALAAQPTLVGSRLRGRQLTIDAASIMAIRARIKYPISVYAEDEELQQALAFDIDNILNGVSRTEDFYISAPFPSTALSVFTLFPGLTGFRLAAGSTLCHLALIARSKGLGFEIGDSLT